MYGILFQLSTFKLLKQTKKIEAQMVYNLQRPLMKELEDFWLQI